MVMYSDAHPARTLDTRLIIWADTLDQFIGETAE
jgi:hypothetical protein